MPLYTCSSQRGLISLSNKARISRAITDVHCKVTAAPPDFVHVFFFDSDPAELEQSTAAAGDRPPRFQLFGSIRAGRTDETKHALVSGMTERVADILAVNASEVGMSTRDVKAQWVMEGGDVLPEPGEEAAWLRRHSEKLAESGS
ncbi:MAG: tautomerase family protein [Pseudomonadota bacterium]